MTIYTVKQQGGGHGIFVDQTVVFQRVSYRGENVWVAEQRRRDERSGKHTFSHQWVDGRTCMQLSDVLDGLGRLPPARFAKPEDKDGEVIFDGASVTLVGPVAGGRWGARLLRSDLGGDLTQWWTESEKALAPCWQGAMVSVGGRPIPVELGTDKAAAKAGLL